MHLIHQSSFPHLVNSLFSYLHDTSLYDPLPVGILSVWMFLLFSLCRSGTSLSDQEASYRQGSKALLTFINPTLSFWPTDIRQAVYSARKNKTIKLSLRRLLGHIVSGTLEFRDPLIDLVKLLKDGEYRVNGWSVQLDVDASWWSVILIWIFKSFTRTSDPHSLLEYGRRRKSYTFDNTPLCQIEAFTRYLQSHVAPGSFITLEFTTRVKHSAWMPKSTLITCSLPFFSRRRTPTPLFLTLHQVIQLLSSGEGAFIVETVQNNSERYAATLCQSVRDMEDNSNVRAEVIERCGVEGWREEKFHLSWEAALIGAGFLARWKVSARKI